MKANFDSRYMYIMSLWLGQFVGAICGWGGGGVWGVGAVDIQGGVVQNRESLDFRSLKVGISDTVCLRAG